MTLQPDQSSEYTLEIRENDERVSTEPIADPFIHTTINVRGRRAAWRVLRGLKLTIVLSASPERTAEVMRLNHPQGDLRDGDEVAHPIDRQGLLGLLDDYEAR